MWVVKDLIKYWVGWKNSLVFILEQRYVKSELSWGILKREKALEWVFAENIEALVDSFIATGNDVSQNDHIEAIFYGLPQDYDPYVISITTDNEVELCLLTQEARLEKHMNMVSTEKITVNLAATKNREKNSSNSS